MFGVLGQAPWNSKRRIALHEVQATFGWLFLAL